LWRGDGFEGWITPAWLLVGVEVGERKEGVGKETEKKKIG
jgi:hypothetical protein